MVVAGFGAGSGSPQPLSNADIAGAGAGAGVGFEVKTGEVDVWVGAGAAAGGSGVAHASFDPHASVPMSKADDEVCTGGAGLGAGGCVGVERLKAAAVGKLRFCLGAGAGAGAGLGCCCAGEDMLKRSPIELEMLDGGGLFVEVTGDGADEKSPKSPPKLLLGFRCAWTAGGFSLGGGAGLASKKLPPLRELFCRPWAVGEVRPENAAGLACG